MHRRVFARNERDNFSCQQQQFIQQKFLLNQTKSSRKHLSEEKWLIQMEDLKGDQDFAS